MMATEAAVKGKVDRFPNLYIGGDWVTPSSGRMIESINPATGQVWAETAETDEKDIDKAVQAARDAFEGEWSRRTPSERGLALRRFADLVSENVDRIASLDTQDNGKHIRESTAEVANGGHWNNYFAGLADKIEGTYLPISGHSEFAYTIRQPLGVVGVIVGSSATRTWSWMRAPSRWSCGGFRTRRSLQPRRRSSLR